MKAADKKRALWIGGGALGAAGLVTAVVLATHKSAAAAPAPIEGGGPLPPPSGGTTGATAGTTFTQGHTYSVTVQCTARISSPLLKDVSSGTISSRSPVGNVLMWGGGAAAFGWTLTLNYTGPTMNASPASMFTNTSGCTVTAQDMGPTTTGVNHGQPLPAIHATTPFNEISPASNVFTLQPFETYLVTTPPIPNFTLAQYVALMQQHPFLTVTQQWDSQTPSGWPSTDTAAGVWRLVVQNGGQTGGHAVHQNATAYTVPATTGLRVWTTAGAAA